MSKAGPCRCDAPQTKSPAVSRRAFREKSSSPRWRDQPAFLVFQIERADTGRDIQAGIAFDADRLQCDRLVETANEHIGAGADADGRAGRHAAIAAFKRARLHVRRRRNDVPDDDAALGIADIDADLGNAADVMLAETLIRHVIAAHVFGRAEDITPAAIDVAGQYANLYARRFRRRKPRAGRKQSYANRKPKFVRHFSLLVPR